MLVVHHENTLETILRDILGKHNTTMQLYLTLYEYLFRRCVSSTYIVEQVRPALHGDTLEDGEDSKQDVVKLCDAVVWSQPVLPTHGALGTQPGRRLRPTWKLFPDLTCTWMKVGRCFKKTMEAYAQIVFVL